MEALDAIYRRRAVRHYSEAEIEDDLVQDLIRAAVQAPSAMNRQPWLFVAVKDRLRLRSWSDQAKAHIAATGDSAAAGFIERLGGSDFDIFYNAPVLVVICATVADPMANHDCCLAAGNLMLAACDRGLGSCWIGFAEAWLATPEGRAALGLGDEVVPVAPIILGYPRALPEPPGRREPAISWIRPARVESEAAHGAQAQT